MWVSVSGPGHQHRDVHLGSHVSPPSRRWIAWAIILSSSSIWGDKILNKGPNTAVEVRMTYVKWSVKKRSFLESETGECVVYSVKAWENTPCTHTRIHNHSTHTHSHKNTLKLQAHKPHHLKFVTAASHSRTGQNSFVYHTPFHYNPTFISSKNTDQGAFQTKWGGKPHRGLYPDLASATDWVLNTYHFHRLHLPTMRKKETKQNKTKTLSEEHHPGCSAQGFCSPDVFRIPDGKQCLS